MRLGDDMRNHLVRAELLRVPRTVLEEAAVFSWIVQENRFCGDENFAKIFGMDKAKVAAGLPIEEFLDRVNPAERPRVAKSVHHSLVTSEPCAQDYEIWRKDGSRVEVSAVARCFRDETGEPVEYIGCMYPHRDSFSDYETLKLQCLDLIDLSQSLGDHLLKKDALRLTLAAVEEVFPEDSDRKILH
ncbi:PAS domain-containing protein [Rhizobium sp. Td3]|nr:PAS domain-containing protein [Rhizobium sp. Td3]